MAKLIILGSSHAIPDENHENTHMAVVGKVSTLLIDCVSNPILRLPRAGIEFDNVTDLILTHFHPDHVSGVPLLLMNMWLLGRKHLLNIYGLHHTLDRVEGLMNFYDWSAWPNFFPVAFHRLPEQEMTPVLANPEFRVIASPVRHLIPTIVLRIDYPHSKQSLVYSCDTEPCPEVVRLASGADVLIHEASGSSPGHSSAGQAGWVAQQSEVTKLYLIHYPTRGINLSLLVEEAKEKFHGSVELAQDFMELDF
jgi:ribonuclease Z